MVGRSTGVIAFGLESRPRKIQIIDENIDHTNRAVFSDMIRQDFVVTRAKSAGNGGSIAMDFREKCFYPS